VSLQERAGYSVWSRSLGTGPRKGLMLHCSLAHGGAWRGLSAQFEGKFTFDAPDFLSHGRSAMWDGKGSYHDACTAVAKSFLSDEPIDLVGHSFGATVALRLALDAPERVRSLVLIEPVFFAVALADDPDFVSDMSALEEVLTNEGRHAATKAFLGQWGGGLPWAMMPKETQDDMASRIQVIIDAGPALYEDTAGMLAAGRMQALDIPVLLLRGGQSPHVVETINTGLARRIPAAQTGVIEGAGHMAPISHPKECSARMRAFWNL
jgi:lipase